LNARKDIVNRIWVIAPPDSSVAAETARRLSEHFGAEQVYTGPVGDKWHPNDAIVLFIETPTAAWADQQLRQQAWANIAEPCLEQALAADALLIPLLVNGVLMPAATQLPPAVQALAYKHALPIRGDQRLPRDVGRLVEDLEAQIRRVVGAAFPLEYWLIPLGVLATALGATYSAIFFRDLSDWSFAYETIGQLRRGLWYLATLGPGLLGAGMLMLVGGLWWRVARRNAHQRAEYFRSGSGDLPSKVNHLAWGTLCAGAGAAGWGLPAALVAFGLGGWALWSTHASDRRGDRMLLATGLIVAGAGAAWTLELVRRESHLRAALAEYEDGRQERVAGRTEAAADCLAAAMKLWPPYANSYFRLAQIHHGENRVDDAMSAVNDAIARYPTAEQGLFGPSVRLAAQALELRSQLYENAGQADAAQHDRDASRALSPWFNIFGGLFRFWEQSDPDALSDAAWIGVHSPVSR